MENEAEKVAETPVNSAKFARGGGYQKLKLGLFIFLFSLTVFSCSAVLTFAAFSGSFGNNFSVEYSVPKPATLVTGQEFAEALKAPGGGDSYSAPDPTVRSVTFDYYSDQYNDVVNNASVVADVATENSGGDVLMYHMESGDCYDVYVLSETEILLNADSSDMFNRCFAFEALYFHNFNTSGVSTMANMFYACNLVALDLSSWDTSSVTNMNMMFYGSSIVTLDLSSWDTSNVTNMKSMFQESLSLTTIYVSNLWSTASVTDGNLMFDFCSQLVGGNGTKYYRTHIDHTYARVDTTNTPGYLTLNQKKGLNEAKLMDYIKDATTVVFDYYSEINNQIISGISCVDISRGQNGSIMLYDVNSNVYILSNETISLAGKSASYLFHNCIDLTNIQFKNFDTSSVIDMSYMFYSCSGLKTLDVSSFDTSNVTSMRSMFSGCSGLSTLDVSNFDTSSVTSMSGMFYYCSGLSTLDLSGWDTSSVTDMGSMFHGCSGLSTLDVSNFDTSSVTSMRSMFGGCSGLSELDLSNFDTSSVTNMDYMFSYCSGLTVIYIGSGWSTASVTGDGSMFTGCKSLPNYDSSCVTHEYCSRYMTLKS